MEEFVYTTQSRVHFEILVRHVMIVVHEPHNSLASTPKKITSMPRNTAFVDISVYIYIYIYMCVCVCVLVTF